MRSMMRSVRASSFVVGLAVDKLAAFQKVVVTELVVQLEARPFVAAASAGGSRLGRACLERRFLVRDERRVRSTAMNRLRW